MRMQFLMCLSLTRLVFKELNLKFILTQYHDFSEDPKHLINPLFETDKALHVFYTRMKFM